MIAEFAGIRRSVRRGFAGMMWAAMAAVLAPTAAVAGGPIRFDVKTHFGEKPNAAAAKAGAIVLLNATGWGWVVEYGEHYCLWLTNYESVKAGDRIRVALTVEVRTPCNVRSGRLLMAKKINVSFGARDTLPPDVRNMGHIARELRVEAYTAGSAVVGTVREMMRALGRKVGEEAAGDSA